MWHAYLVDQLDIMSVRVHLACLEIDHQQSSFGHGDPIEDRLADLTGARPRAIKEAIRDLQALSHQEDHPGFEAFLARFANKRPLLPIPRRILRTLCRKNSTDSLIATALGHIMRGLFYTKSSRSFQNGGRVKDSWIVERFGVGIQAVARARKKLVELGWLEEQHVDQGDRNLWGSRFSVNLEWKGESGAPCRDLIGPPPVSCRDLIPPIVNKRPLRITGGTETNNPKSAIGFSIEDRGIGKPNLRRMVTEDLRNQDRLGEIYDQAVAANMIRPSEHAWVKFRAEARHALAVGIDPLSLFFSNISNGRWYATGADEDAGGRRPPPPKQVCEEPIPCRPRREPVRSKTEAESPPPSPEELEAAWRPLANRSGPLGERARRMLGIAP